MMSLTGFMLCVCGFALTFGQQVSVNLRTGAVTGSVTSDNGFQWIARPSGFPGNTQCNGRGVLKLTFNPQRVRAHIQMTLTNNPRGATFHIGDSATNDGYAGDYGTQANDAEVHSIDKTIYFYGRDRSPGVSYGLLYSRANFLTTNVIMDIKDEWAAADNGNSNLLIDSPKLFALNGQPDFEGPVNKDVYVAMNQVITGRQSRQGTGLCSITVTWFSS
ncbi:uncharacterized protein LOC112561517 [Pomacea canaliculata]|uniref:uncharacterized protein LOC112561517 n=1 Tax=Pomacea canaliculata TaxID=400727 RepID=UPI000D730888|nr:uncharacterized protein LOC112561517 [Pomacea canaliculata]XP_025089852.1 uncharacterized protein LOC112561517 [Pomacea canaliculata]